MADVAYLKLLKQVIEDAPPRVVNTLETRSNRVVAWVDGAWSNGVGSLGGAVQLVSPDGNVVGKWFFSEKVPDEIVKKWREWAKQSSRKQFNTQTEILAIIMFMETFQHIIRDASVLVWEDNKSAQFNCLRGSSRNELSAGLVVLFWWMAKNLRAIPWFDRVASASNCADNPSKGDIAMMTRLGCIRVEGKLPLEAFKSIEFARGM